MAYSSALPLARFWSGLWSDWSEAVTLLRSRMRKDCLARRVVIGLIVLNLVLIGLPVVLEQMERVGLLTPVSRPMLHPTVDGSWPEILNYAQTALCSVALMLAAWRFRSVMALAWALVFAFVLFDDALQYHETVGAWLAQGLALPAIEGLRAVDLGELIAWGLAGMVVAPALAWAFLRTSGTDRGMGLVLLVLFAGLVVFGVGVDMLHVVFPSPVLLVAEDGGEMMAIALAAAVSLFWARAPRSPRPAFS